MPIHVFPLELYQLASILTITGSASSGAYLFVKQFFTSSQDNNIQSIKELIQEKVEHQEKIQHEKNILVDINGKSTPSQENEKPNHFTIPFDEPLFFENIKPNFTPEPQFSPPQETIPQILEEDIEKKIKEQQPVIKEQEPKKPKNNKHDKKTKNTSKISPSEHYLNKYVIEDY